VPEPLLTLAEPSGPLHGLVLMLHGGAEHNIAPVGDRSRPWLRSRLMMRQIQGRLHAEGVGVWLLRYRVVGWNEGHPLHPVPSPVPDARWALDRIRAERPGVPVVLLGHSMGARTSVAVAADHAVVGVVGVAPWLPDNEPVEALAGKHLALAHGHRDKVTFANATRKFLDRAAAVASDTEYVDMGPVGHYLIKRRRAWNDFAASRSLEFLK
jgi:predicted esterase